MVSRLSWGECYNIEETTVLDFGGNQLLGEIPEEICNLTNLTELELGGNQLSGEIPSCIGNLTNLTFIHLEYNQLSGEIPYEIGNLTNLIWLNFVHNELSGEIPLSICNLDMNWSNPDNFNIYENQLCPPYPECIEDYVGEQDTSECEEPSLCNENMYWSDCGLPFYCNSTCLNPDPLPECDDYCEIGCFCNEGYIFSDDTYSECILIENCSECNLTTDDILGPYYFEDAPFRSVIAHADEPGQRLFISGNVMQNDCGNSISGSLIEIWQANDEGCYGIVEDCDTGNPENDYFNLRGKFFSDENGDYTFESILPGYYGSRPKHIHIKITTPNGEELVSQLYFENDPYCEDDQWCQDADDRIIPLIEDEYGLNGEIDLIMNSTENGISLGDINFDNLLNVQDIVLLVGIILNNSIPNDFQIYSGDINNDNNIDILDIVQLVAIIIN